MIFCDREYSADRDLLALLGKVRYRQIRAGRYQHLGNNGTVIYIQATYKTIVDLDGKPYNKVKSAIDMTEQVDLKTRIQTKAESDACDKITSSDAKIAAR